MRAWGIRWKLTIWYGVVLSLILIAFDLGVYEMVRRHLSTRIDQELRVELHELGQEIAISQAQPDFLRELELRFGRHQNCEFEVHSPDGHSLFRSTRLGQEHIGGAVSQASATPAIAETTIAGLGRFRTASQTIDGAVGPLWIQVAAPLAPYLAELRAFGVILSAAGPLALATALGGGYVLARKALTPVDRMAAAARQISARRLDRRIEVPHAHDELGRLAETLNDMIDRLRDSFDEMRRFTADAAHELRTPLAVLQSEAEVALRASRTEEEYRRVLESILEETVRLSRLADQLLTLCRQDAGLAPATVEQVRLDILVHNVAEHLRVVAAEKGLAWEITPLEPYGVAGDAAQLRQVFVNLFDNAIKYTPAGGRIAIAGAIRDGRMVISVTDTGLGIPPEHLPHVFDRFYRVDKSRSRDPGGTGLGLAICKAIVESHGGGITIGGNLGTGTRVCVSLPGQISR